jgi:hypothetical protein
MNTAVATLGNVADLLAQSGFSAPAQSNNTLIRVKLLQEPIMGVEEIKGKVRNVEVVPAGYFKIEIPNQDGAVYTENLTARVYQQRVSTYRYNANAEGSAKYIKSVMHTDLKSDLKDSNGTFNCGKSNAYIDKEEWATLDAGRQDFIKSVKRVRTVLGTSDFTNLIDASGNPVEGIGTQAFLLEVKNPESFKEVGNELSKYAKAKVLPLQHPTLFTTVKNTMHNGKTYYAIVAKADMVMTYEISDTEVETFNNFNDWVGYFNNWVMGQWQDKQEGGSSARLSSDDEATVDGFVNVDTDDEIPF